MELGDLVVEVILAEVSPQRRDCLLSDHEKVGVTFHLVHDAVYEMQVRTSCSNVTTRLDPLSLLARWGLCSFNGSVTPTRRVIYLPEGITLHAGVENSCPIRVVDTEP